MVRIHNAETDEILDREMTDEEFAQHELDQESIAALKAQNEALELTRESKKAKLLALGLTEQEINS